MKKIVMFSGGVETLEFFSEQMAQQFEKMGYSVFFFDLKRERESERRLRTFVCKGETVMLTFNFQGLEKEPGVYKEETGYIWDEYQIPCYNIAADHPYYYDDRLRELPKHYFHISIDRLHQAYFREYYPEYEDAGFLPLAGTELFGTEEALRETPWAERPIDVIFTGNYTPPSFCEPYICRLDEEYTAFYRSIIEELLEHPDRTVEEAALRHCRQEMGEVSGRELRTVFHHMIFIDLYVRNYWRGMAVKTLVDAGIKVDVVGKRWEELECAHRENLVIHPQTDSLECLRMLCQAKLSLNVMPWFKDGAHDRVFNSVLNGAVCISDRSGYLCETLAEGEGICYFELERLAELPQLTAELLTHKETARGMAARGREKVRKEHLWKNRAAAVAVRFEKNARKSKKS